MREKKPELDRLQLKELVSEFHENTLFADELAKLGVPPDSAGPAQEGQQDLSQ